jgi:murein DD-endopeptidase MepM/ murein hydrolase activator NlpD
MDKAIRFKHLFFAFSASFFMLTIALPASAFRAAAETPDPPPFGLPFNTPPGPSTWLLGQLYGNTSSAYTFREVWYAAGQGLHFGIDFPAPCGTEVTAIGDGVVVKVDAREHGAGPHNLLIRHPDVEPGYVSLYGHLVERPSLQVNDKVVRGQVVGLTGDPDLTCTSRPHLHLEVRSLDYRTAYNPVPLIDADWDSLALIGQYRRGFQQDLNEPRRWQYADEQPDVRFGGPLLNNYTRPWPPVWRGFP